ncbi:protein of unknown function DUF59 [Cynara cardunculus var. scolymus]|uniref:MIP18 family-like domain-containing protein n=1 Tax=Cynara cardunculus var. scolymus TaxID=59895 RepID=A0A103XQS2_CYNCS|nr:protein of unknown function DUF59 [Cynara cardunculus var. scolymus]
MAPALINANPVVYEKKERPTRSRPGDGAFLHHIRDIKDPEHPYSLEELKVITEDAIEVDDKRSYVRVTFTPTVEHCSMATVIGLCLRVKLMRSLPSRFKVDIKVAPGTHATEDAATKCKDLRIGSPKPSAQITYKTQISIEGWKQTKTYDATKSGVSASTDINAPENFFKAAIPRRLQTKFVVATPLHDRQEYCTNRTAPDEYCEENLGTVKPPSPTDSDVN